MKLAYNFPEYVRSLFADIQPCCIKCGSNQMCSIHHIYGRISNSMFNGATLCQEHHQIGDSFNVAGGVKGRKYRQDLLFLTMRSFYKDRWWEQYLSMELMIENDRFFEIIQEDLFVVAKYIV